MRLVVTLRREIYLRHSRPEPRTRPEPGAWSAQDNQSRYAYFLKAQAQNSPLETHFAVCVWPDYLNVPGAVPSVMRPDVSAVKQIPPTNSGRGRNDQCNIRPKTMPGRRQDHQLCMTAANRQSDTCDEVGYCKPAVMSSRGPCVAAGCHAFARRSAALVPRPDD